jgi:anti-sigma factor RsiW
MNCSEVKELLSPYIDGMLDEGQSKELARAAEACGACGLELRQTEEMVAALRGLPGAEIPERLEIRLKAAIASEGRAVRRARAARTWRRAGSVAAVVARGWAAGWVYNGLDGRLGGLTG